MAEAAGGVCGGAASATPFISHTAHAHTTKARAPLTERTQRDDITIDAVSQRDSCAPRMQYRKSSVAVDVYGQGLVFRV